MRAFCKSLALALLATLVACSPVESSAATQAQIDKAVDAGAKHLLSTQRDDGSWTYVGHDDGATALAGFALLESGVPANDPAILKAAEFCRQRAPRCTHTYSIALLIFFFDRLGQKQDQPLIAELGERLRNGQSQNGAWSYYCSAYPGAAASPIGGDNSNTQFAIMGLWVARRHGVEVRDALAKIDQFYRRTQSTDGGWQYMANDSMPALPNSTGPMTCAGLLGLLVHFGSQGELRAVRSKEELKAATNKDAPPAVEPLKDEAVQRGLKRLEQHMMNGGRPWASLGIGTELYFLWSIERMAAAYGLKKIGAIDWYDAGCDRLLPKQAPDGSWKDYNSSVGTSLALLFLKRANFAADLTRMVQAGDGATLKAGIGPPQVAVAKPPKPEEKRPSASFTPAALAGKSPTQLVAAIAGAKAEDQRRVLQELHDRKGGEATVALVEAIPAVDVALRATARDLLAARLQRMTATTLTRYLADENAEIQKAAVAAAGAKKDKSLASQLIDLLDHPKLADEAHAALVACTGQDFGRFEGADKAERFVIVKKWKAWRETQ